MTEIAPPLVLLRRGQLSAAVGSERLAEQLVSSKFLKPILSNARLALFLVSDIEPAIVGYSQATAGDTNLKLDDDKQPDQTASKEVYP